MREHRPVGADGVLGVALGVVAGGARADRDRGRVMAVVDPALAVVPDQLGVRPDRVGHVGGEQRIAVAGREVHRLLARGAAVPDPDRPLQRARPHLGPRERRPEPGVVGDLVVPPQTPEHLVGLGVAVPLVLRGDLEQVALRGAVALADDQLKPPAGEVVKRRVVLERPHRVKQRQRRHRREEADPAGERREVTEHDGRRGGDERPLVPFTHPEAVEAQFLGEQGAVDDLTEPVRRGDLGPGDGVRGVHDQRDGDEPHEAALATGAAPGRPSGASPRWSRSVVPV